MTDKEMAILIAEKVKEAGGTTYFVGGCVRDKLLGLENKDIDIEVHWITPDVLKSILDSVGEHTEHGKSFGVYGVKGYDIDIAMPRTERSTGIKHTSFEVDVNPYLGEIEASRRRDFTINALMENVLTGEIVDIWGGIQDLKDKIIRHVDREKFQEDALRVFRAARFAAKLDFTVAKETISLCKTIDTSNLSKERVFGETKTALLKSERPSVYFEQLRKMNQLSEWFSELEATIGVMQNEVFHKEGDVWTHTMMALDEAAKLREEAQYPLGFMTAVLCHDMGKPHCTSIDDKGVHHAYNHEAAGVPYAKEFLLHLTDVSYLRKYVLNMVELHGEPHTKAEHQSSVKSTNHMYDKALVPEDLILHCVADSLGKLPQDMSERIFLEERLQVYRETMGKPFVQGRDLVNAGIKPNKQFTEYLEYAHKLRLAGVDKESAMKQVLSMANKDKRKEEKGAGYDR